MADLAGVLRPKSFRGHDIQSSTYSSRFSVPRGGVAAMANPSGNLTKTERPANSPLSVRFQQEAKTFPLEITIKDFSQANLEQLKQWFDPDDGEDYLVAVPIQDDLTEGDERRILCQPLSMVPIAEGTNKVWQVNFESVVGLWEENTTDEEAAIDTATINDSGDTFTITNPGTAKSYPTLTFRGSTVKDSAVSYPTRNRVSIAHRSELKPFDDPNCPDGGPIDVSEYNLSADDGYRVMLYGREQNRWLSSDGGQMWVNLTLPPRSATLMTLGADIDGSALELTAGNPGGFASLPEGPAFIMIDEERILYAAKSSDKRTLTGLVRGMGNTSAASHLTDAPVYTVPLPYLDVLSGIDSPDTPPQDPDRKPVIDLDLSSNLTWSWTGQLYVPNSHRSGQWVPSFVDEGLSSHHLRIDPSDLTTFIFEDLLPSAGLSRFNNLIRDFPCGLKASAGVFTLDFDVGVNLLLQAFVTDVDGNESRLITEYFSDGAQTGQAFDSGDILKRIRLNARIAAILGSLDSTVVPNIEVLALNNNLVSILASGTDANGNDYSQTEAVSLYGGIQFGIEKEADVAGLIIKLAADFGGASALSGDVVLAIAADSGGKPVRPILANFGISSGEGGTSPIVTLRSPEGSLVLPSGTYWAIILPVNDSYAAVSGSQLDPGVHFWQHVPYPPALQLGDSSTGGVLQIPFDNDELYINNADYGTPFFAVLSRTAEPQSDAPLQTGNTIAISNPIAVFDDDTPRTLKIVVGSAEDCYLFGTLTDGAKLTNETTGEYIKFRFPSALGVGFSVDFENRLVTDEETGLPIPHAIVGVSNPNDWPSNQPGANIWSWTDEGIGGGDGVLTIDGISRGRYN